MARLYAVGVGPGDPELLTRKAERILRNVDVVLAPVSRKNENSVALETVQEFLDAGRQEIIVHQFPMTADTSRLLPAWQAAAAILADRVASGKDAAFITIGDPLLYSTFIYLLRILRESHAQVEVEIVPGISSIMTAAAVAAVPLVEADEKMVVIPATAGIAAIQDALAMCESVVILKVKPLYAEILELLKSHGQTHVAVFVERVGSSRQRVIRDYTEMAAHEPDYLSLMIVRRQLFILKPAVQ